MNKFEEFYYLTENRLCSLYEIEQEYRYLDRSMSRYTDCMYCPECKKAKLTYRHGSNGKHGYLAKLPSSNHDITCTYNYEEGSKKVVTQYIDSLSEGKLQDKLETALNLLIRSKQKNNVEVDNKGMRDTFLIRTNNTKESQKYVTIPRKSLNSWLDKECEEVPYIFYGKVRVKLRSMISKIGNEYYMLDLLTAKRDGTWKYKISVFLNKYMYYHCKIDSLLEDKDYAVALCGKISSEYGYMQIKLLNNGFSYREVKDGDLFEPGM